MDTDEVIGGLVAYELLKFEQERKEIYVYDHRGRAELYRVSGRVHTRSHRTI